MNFWSYRRKLLDGDLEEAKGYMKGIVLDVGGGRKRGNFKKPDNASWIVFDVNKELLPNILGDDHNLPIKSNTIDCVKCTKVLEHVEYPERAIKDFARILKPGGFFILSMPSNFPIHADPYAFQRFTDYKLRKIFEENFEILTFKNRAYFFTVLGHMLKQAIINMKSKFKRVFYLTFLFLSLLVKLDETKVVKNSKYLSSFTTRIFMIAQRKFRSQEDALK